MLANFVLRQVQVSLQLLGLDFELFNLVIKIGCFVAEFEFLEPDSHHFDLEAALERVQLRRLLIELLFQVSLLVLHFVL